MTTTLGHGEAVEHLFVEHREAIRRFLLSMTHDPAEAEDLTQETLLRAHSRLGTLRDETKLLPWIYRIATNIARDRFRQPSWQRPEESLEAEDSAPSLQVLDDAPRLDKVMEQREMSTCVREYLDTLSDSYRAVILLHDVEGLTNPEIADLLGISLDAAKIRLHRARARLRRKLAEGCDVSTDERGVGICEPRADVGDE